MGSACELEYQMILTKDLKYISNDFHLVIEDKIVQIKKMLNAFITKINQRLNPLK